MTSRVDGRRVGAAICAAVVAATMTAPALSQAPATAARVKELATLLQARKLEAFATRVPDEPKRFVAARLIPNVQLLTVMALHQRHMDMEYYLYNKDHRNAYLDLNSSTFATERTLIDDAMADGLVALPGRNLAHDGVVNGSERVTFDGLFDDGRRRNEDRMPKEAYMKAFAAAEQAYLKMLDILIAELKAG